MNGSVLVTAGEPPLAASAGAAAARTLTLAGLTATAQWLETPFATSPFSTPVIGVAAGVALAGVLLGGNRLWPGIVLGICLAHLRFIWAATFMAPAFAAMAAIGAGVALQAIISAALFRAVVRVNDPFRRARDAGWFIVLTAGLGSVISPAVSVTVAGICGAADWNSWSGLWFQEWLSDLVGVLTATPFLLAWAHGGRLRWHPWQGPELIVLAVAPAAVYLTVERTNFALEYLYLPLLAWAAFRFGARGATSMTVAVAVLALAATENGFGAFVAASPEIGRYLLCSFIGMVASATLVLLGVIAQLHAAEHGLADARATLETRVRLRTQELAAANGRLRRIADLDGLTGVPNRRYFDCTVETEWNRAASAGRSLAVILMDVDYFKLFNDTYGHPAGDNCLKLIADALSSGLQRNGELLARYGGEEFVALLPNTDAASAIRTAERLRQRVAALGIPHCVPADGALVTLSAGIAAEVPTSRRTPSDLLASADAALYTAKNAGRDRVCQ